MRQRPLLPTLVLCVALAGFGCDSDDDGSQSDLTSGGDTTSTAGDVDASNDTSTSTAGDLTTSTADDLTASTGDTSSTTAADTSIEPDVADAPPVDATTADDTMDDVADAIATPPPPTNASDLVVWIGEGHYESWAAESAPHASAGPHFGTVRTFVNESLRTSLADGNTAHPVGAAAVKELYGDGDTVLGYAVMVKVDAAATSAGWYWYEGYQGTEYADGEGVSLCSNCHSGGTDHILTPFPLQ